MNMHTYAHACACVPAHTHPCTHLSACTYIFAHNSACGRPPPTPRRNTITTSFKLVNASPKKLVYTLSHLGTDNIGATDSMPITYSEQKQKYVGASYQPDVHPAHLSVSFNGTLVAVNALGQVAVTLGPKYTAVVEVTFTIPAALRQKGYLIAGYLVATLNGSPTATSAPANLTLPYLGYTSPFNTISWLNPSMPGGIILPADLVIPHWPNSTSDGVELLFSANGKQVAPPYTLLWANTTHGGKKPLVPQYTNDHVSANMPIILLNIQHQPLLMQCFLVQQLPKNGNGNGKGQKKPLTLLVENSSPFKSMPRSMDPLPLPVG